MILEKQKQAEILIDGGEGNATIQMTLDLDSASFLMQMLSKNIYQDAIGSAIRESVSNSLDSKRKANSDKPVIVSLLQTSTGDYEFSTEDWGTGLDDEDVLNILSKYGASTKRNDAKMLGAWGLGFKAPLAYSSSFYFITRKNGIERKYMMYEGEDGNSIDLLYEQATEEGNGVKVVIPVQWRDRLTFKEKIEEQLCYFEDVYFNVSPTLNIDNNFKIFRSEDYQMSEMCPDDYMHICLDNVYYPIDYTKLGISSIKIPVGLRFGLSDGIFPTVNRESIRLSVEAKQIILDKIKKVCTQLVEEYNLSIVEKQDIKSIVLYYREDNYILAKAGKSMYIKNAVKHSDITLKEPQLNEIKLLSLKELIIDKWEYLFGEYESKYRFSSNKIKDDYGRIDFSFNREFYVFENSITGNKRDYLRDVYRDTWNQAYFIKKKKSYSLFRTYFGYTSSYTDYVNILDLRRHPKSEWRQRIKEFQYVQSLLTANFINYDTLEIPKEWLDKRKKKYISTAGNRRKKLEGEINCKIGRPLEKYLGADRFCKFEADVIKLQDIPRYKRITLYCHHDDGAKLEQLFKILSPYNPRLITVSTREMKTLSSVEAHNLISYEEFMKGNTKLFKRIVTAYLIKKFIDVHKKTFERKYIINKVASPLYEEMDILWKYARKYAEGAYSSYSTSTVYESMVDVAKKNNLFDMRVLPIYEKMQETFKQLPFLDIIFRNFSSSYEDDAVKILVDLFKRYEYRINLEHYQKPVIEEIVEEQEIEEEETDDMESLLEELEIQN